MHSHQLISKYQEIDSNNENDENAFFTIYIRQYGKFNDASEMQYDNA